MMIFFHQNLILSYFQNYVEILLLIFHIGIFLMLFLINQRERLNFFHMSLLVFGFVFDYF